MRGVVTSFRNRYKQSIEKRTQQLDPDVREALAHDVVHEDEGNETELQEIETALDEAKEQLAKFQKSEAFISQRISSYRRQLDDRATQLKREQKQKQQQQQEQQQQQQQQQCLEENNTTATATASPPETENLTEHLVVNNNNEEIDGEEETKNDSGIDHDEEIVDELAQGFEKLRMENRALAEVVETQKGVIANIESMRRKVTELEHKRSEILKKREENKEFLVAAGIAADDYDFEIEGGDASAAATTEESTVEDTHKVSDEEEEEEDNLRDDGEESSESTNNDQSESSEDEKAEQDPLVFAAEQEDKDP